LYYSFLITNNNQKHPPQRKVTTFDQIDAVHKEVMIKKRSRIQSGDHQINSPFLSKGF
jgi:hypothetical protein